MKLNAVILHDKIDDPTIVQKIICFANRENAAASDCSHNTSRLSSLHGIDVDHLAIATLFSIMHVDNFDGPPCDQFPRHNPA